MNGALGARQLGGVRFEKKQSVDGSVSSMETLTTPLSLDQSRDNPDELFLQARTAGTGRNRNVSGGSNLNPVPESPVEDAEHSYYNTSDASSIDSYSKAGYKDPLAPESPCSGTNSSGLPAALLGSADDPNYHTLVSPETSPVRSTPKDGPLSGSSGDANKGAASSITADSPRGQQSPTAQGPVEYDVPSMISPYSKFNCVDEPVPDYDSSAGSFASTDTVIDTFKHKKAAPMPPPDDYVSQGFMESMASNTSLNSSDASDIDPYTVVGERDASGSSITDTYVDDEGDSDESQPLCHDSGQGSNVPPPAPNTNGYVQAPPPMLKTSTSNDNSAYVQAPPPPPVSKTPLTNGYVQTPPALPPGSTAPPGKPVNELPPTTDSGSYLPHTSLNGIKSGRFIPRPRLRAISGFIKFL